jgi:NAD(P)-dependent dehydrogenase (short-subunit alcohol dehydrogenase family)
MAESKRIAVVTGASRGLGLETCAALGRLGQRVLLTARKAEDAERRASELRAQGLDVIGYALDVASDTSVDAFVVAVEREHGRVDVLVNNAGAVFEDSGGSATVPASALARAFEVNALGAYRVTRAFLPRMNRHRYGRVVNVSSGMGSITEMIGGSPAYRVSKAALNALTRIFHAEAGDDVKVNSICPGWVRTDMGGPRATRSVSEGAAGIVWAATLPNDGPSGGFFRDGEPIAF